MPAQSNWKVTEETLKRVNQACLDLGVTQARLAEIALQALAAQDPSFEPVPFLPVDPTTPHDDHERAIVQAALALDRETDEPEFREILYVLLRRWLPKSFKAGKRTA